MTQIKGRLAFFTPPIGTQCGYGYAAEQMLLALNRAGIRTEYNTTGDDAPEVHISFVQPPWYMGDEKQYRIGYTPWESSEIEPAWVFYMNEMDEIWTPSPYCADVFRKAGVTKPIEVVPHGINPEHYPILRNKLPHGKFTFGHIGGPTERKGGQRVFDAFVDLFEGNNSVQLLMKSTGPSEARYRDPEYDTLHNVSYHPQVRVNEQGASIEEMQAFHASIDCMVYPSRGEGFGLIPFNSIASGIPTIVTNGTAMADYAELSVPLDWKETNGFGIHLGKWCDPDTKDLRDKMLYVYEYWAEAKTKTLKSAEYLHANQTWDHIANQIIEICGDRLRWVTTENGNKFI